MNRLENRLFVLLLTLAVAVLPAAAWAQSAPSGTPSYAVPGPAPAADRETIHGQVASFDTASGSLQLNDDRGFVDNVQLGQGTVVRPQDAQLQPGMVVTIVGVAQGSVFAADSVDVGGTAAGGPALAGPIAPAPPPPPQPPAPPMAGPPMAAPPDSGSVLTGLIDGGLDSKSASPGDPVTLYNVTSTDGAIVHATLLGQVTDVTPAGQGRNAQVRLHFDRLRLLDGTERHIDGVVMAIDVKTKSNAAKEIGGALIGMLAGNALGKALGINGGGIVGAAGGFLIAKDNRANVVIPADSAVTVELVNPRRQTQ
jgi:hypothetical protein